MKMKQMKSRRKMMESWRITCRHILHSQLDNSLTPPPTLEEAATALDDLKFLIQPRRPSGIGHKDPKLDLLLRSRLEKMRMFLWNYTKLIGAKRWQAASLMTADAYGKSTWLAGHLCEWTRAYILDRNDLPLNMYGTGTLNSSILEDEDFKGELLLHRHLQGIGKYVKSMDVVDYIKQPDVLTRPKLEKTISLATAQRWTVKHVGYRWSKTPTGHCCCRRMLRA
ncbi:hypothetical protein K503DRAFT_719663 [Rhizopogon vinicolor AM-OR11-026]|uniref:Uncharacterized protein n=1 Tax=Rhizopogon vinicolor AM-OR11-026 TaxID=1314800 RepID=A0A1B7MY19_9AGAM|nr:hypothetical protein K503DRAFT_719663 [Rhizopogon vinicolor AM-OR11-026]